MRRPLFCLLMLHEQLSSSRRKTQSHITDEYWSAARTGCPHVFRVAARRAPLFRLRIKRQHFPFLSFQSLQRLTRRESQLHVHYTYFYMIISQLFARPRSRNCDCVCYSQQKTVEIINFWRCDVSLGDAGVAEVCDGLAKLRLAGVHRTALRFSALPPSLRIWASANKM